MDAITAELVQTGEKHDQRGRRMTPPERRAALVREYKASGLTQAAFARREGLRYSTFAHWVLQMAKGIRPSGYPLVREEERMQDGGMEAISTEVSYER